MDKRNINEEQFRKLVIAEAKKFLSEGVNKSLQEFGKQSIYPALQKAGFNVAPPFSGDRLPDNYNKVIAANENAAALALKNDYNASVSQVLLIGVNINKKKFLDDLIAKFQFADLYKPAKQDGWGKSVGGGAGYNDGDVVVVHRQQYPTGVYTIQLGRMKVEKSAEQAPAQQVAERKITFDKVETLINEIEGMNKSISSLSIDLDSKESAPVKSEDPAGMWLPNQNRDLDVNEHNKKKSFNHVNENEKDRIKRMLDYNVPKDEER